MYKNDRDYKKEIATLLKEERLYIGQVADRLKICRATAAKYLSILEAEGILRSERLTVSKLYWVKE